MLVEEDVMISLDLLLILPETSSAISVREEVTAFLTPSETAVAAMVVNTDPVCAFLRRLRFDGEDMEREMTHQKLCLLKCLFLGISKFRAEQLV